MPAKGKWIYRCKNICGSITLSKEKVDGRDFKGLIELEDKIVLLVNQNDKRNVDMRGVFQVTESVGIMTHVDMTRNVDSLKNNKQYTKE